MSSKHSGSSRGLLGGGLLCALALAACGGSGGSTASSGSADTTPGQQTLAAEQTAAAASPSTASATSSATSGTAGAPATAVVQNPQLAALPVLAMPASVTNGSVVTLACGRTYQGTLDLKGKSNVTVKVDGVCGKPVLSPGQRIAGWTKYQGNIYSAPVAFDPAQVLVDDAPLAQAHWPSRSQTWATASGSTATSLSYAMPNADLTGATLIFKPYEWSVEARKVTGYAGGTMTLAATDDPNYDGYGLSGKPEFYVQGKLWMLDEPGEWAFSNGRLYVWTADGQSPEGRVWASPDRHGIDAANSRNVSIDGVLVYGAANGIHAADATGLRATNVEIANSSGNGIMNSGGAGLLVDNASIRNSRHDGIIVKWGGGGESITRTRVVASGVTGMPVNAHAGIALTMSDGATLRDTTVTNSAYTGIRVYRNATVAGNTIDGACLVLSDCGGLYAAARDMQPLNTRIENNTVRNVGKNMRLAWGIFLDDYANGVTVTANTVTGSGNGMMIHNGFANVVQGNQFSASTQSHLQMYESAATATVMNNTISGNRFSAANGEETYRISSDRGGANVAAFASWNNNTYASSSAVFANFNGEPLGYAQWKARTGQDSASVLTAP